MSRLSCSNESEGCRAHSNTMSHLRRYDGNDFTSAGASVYVP